MLPAAQLSLLLQFPEMLVPGILEKVQLEQPPAYATIGPLVRDATQWALTLTTADFKPGPTSSVQFVLVATNATLWCGATAADAAPAIQQSQQRSFADARPYHEVLAAEELPVVWINGTGIAADAAPAEEPAAAAPGLGNAIGSIDVTSEPDEQSAVVPEAVAAAAAAPAAGGSGGSGAAGESLPGGRFSPRDDSRLRTAVEAGAEPPAAAISAGDGGGADSWLVPFLSVVVVGASP